MASDRAESLEDAVERDILRYLYKHPTATDSIEGIVDWWIRRQRIDAAVTAVRGALRELIVVGFVREYKGRDTRPRYGINERRLREIARFLDEGPLP